MATLVIGDLDNVIGSHYSLYGGPGSASENGLKFTLPADGTVTSVTTDWWKQGAPTDGLITRIATSLDGTILGTSAAIPAASVPGAAYARLDFTFTPGVSLTGGVEYALEWERTGVRNVTDHYVQVATYMWPDTAPYAAWYKWDGTWYEYDPIYEGWRGYLTYVPALALKNPQTTTLYDTKVRTKENQTDVVAKEYDSERTTRKPSMNVTATVEGSR